MGLSHHAMLKWTEGGSRESRNTISPLSNKNEHAKQTPNQQNGSWHMTQILSGFSPPAIKFSYRIFKDFFKKSDRSGLLIPVSP